MYTINDDGDILLTILDTHPLTMQAHLRRPLVVEEKFAGSTPSFSTATERTSSARIRAEPDC